MSNVGDRILHKEYDHIFGVVNRVIDGGFSEARWYKKERLDNSLEDKLGYLVVESEDNWVMLEPAFVEYKYDPNQSGDTEDDI